MADVYDLIDALIDDLNDGVEDVTFDRDVLDTNRPDDWAAVELTGQDDAEWADGTMVDQVLTADIWVCVSSRGSGVKRQVQAVLKAFTHPILAGWRFVKRAYLYDLDKVMWQWQISIDAPLAEDEDEDELPFTDPEEDPEDEDTWPDPDPEDGEN